MFDIVSIGNVLIDSFLSIHEANDYCRLDRQTGEFCVKSGEKIPLEQAQFELGGNACNVSVALSRLGLHSGLIAEFGSDGFAHRIKRQLEDEQVSLTHAVSTDTSTSIALGINFKNERTLFVWHVERGHNFTYDSLRTKWIYLTSMGDKWRHVYHEVPAFVKRSGCKLAFNPGTRQIAAGKEVLNPVFSVTDILFLNKEEAEKVIYGREKEVAGNYHEYIELLAKQLQHLGPKTIVITDGQRGSFTLTENGNFYKQSIIPVQVIEKTGAGDSFSAGFLAATIYEHDIQTAMKWGAVNAAAVIGKVGAQPGLLTKQHLEKNVERI